MPGPDDESLEHLKRWMGKLFPVGTQVIDGQGDHHRVVGGYVSNARVRLKLTRTVRGKPIGRDVAFDEVMGWARFPPDSQRGSCRRPRPERYPPGGPVIRETPLGAFGGCKPERGLPGQGVCQSGGGHKKLAVQDPTLKVNLERLIELVRRGRTGFAMALNL